MEIPGLTASSKQNVCESLRQRATHLGTVASDFIFLFVEGDCDWARCFWNTTLSRTRCRTKLYHKTQRSVSTDTTDATICLSSPPEHAPDLGALPPATKKHRCSFTMRRRAENASTKRAFCMNSVLGWMYTSRQHPRIKR